MGLKSKARTRARRRQAYPKQYADDTVDWKVEVCDECHVHLTVFKGNLPPIEVALKPEDAYDLMSDLGRGYDEAACVEQRGKSWERG